jgi:hypothetical protein
MQPGQFGQLGAIMVRVSVYFFLGGFSISISNYKE